jgi:hypothetical protein
MPALIKTVQRLNMAQLFVTIDFETAKADLASICQVGVVTFQDGKVVEALDSLVNHEDYFDWMNSGNIIQIFSVAKRSGTSPYLRKLTFVFSFFHQHVVKQCLNVGLILGYPFAARKPPGEFQIAYRHP